VPAIVTPNGDGRGDSATITYRLTAPALVTASVVDSFGDTVGTLFSQRKTAGTQSFVWSSVALPDGRYRLVLAAKDDRGTQVQTTRPISVDRTLASFATSAAAVSPNGDGRLDTLAFSFRLNATAHVQLRILRAGTLVATPFDADLQSGAQRVDWDGGGLRDGRYSAVVVATDRLLTIKQSVFVRVDTKPPVLRLASLRLLRFWLSEPGRLTVVLNGRAHVLAVKRAGFFRVGHRGSIRTLRAFLRDAAGNQSRQIRGP